MLHTTAAIHSKNGLHLDFHLNDINPSVVARNILLLQIMSAQDFSADCEEDIAFLWDLWYNAQWPESSRRRFKIALKKLMDGIYMLPKRISICGSSLESLQKVWNAWYTLCSQSESQSHLLMKKINSERYRKTFVTLWLNIIVYWLSLHAYDIQHTNDLILC